jgi:hypothetical protein
MDHTVNIVKRPVYINNRSFNRQHDQPPPKPLMNVPTTSFSSPPSRSYSQYRPSFYTSRECYECHRVGHIAKYCPNRKNV